MVFTCDVAYEIWSKNKLDSAGSRCWILCDRTIITQKLFWTQFSTKQWQTIFVSRCPSWVAQKNVPNIRMALCNSV